MSASSATLPGIVFETDAPVPPNVLPRMDIAGFVGYASRGPLHLPVPIESASRLRDVFGPDLELAWDDGAGRMLTSHLGRSVEHFFASAGRRCWVVRVAALGDDGAEANEFPVPGLVDGSGLPVRAQARAAGTWSDGLRVGSVLDRRVIGVGETASEGTILLTRPAVDIRVGDMLELDGDDVRFATVRSVTLETVGSPRVRVDINPHGRFRRNRDLGSGACTASFVRHGEEIAIDLPAGELEPPSFTYVADESFDRPEAGDELRLTVTASQHEVLMDIDDVSVEIDDAPGQVRITLSGETRWRASARVIFAGDADPIDLACTIREEDGYWVEFELPATDRRPAFADVIHVTMTGSGDVAWLTVADVDTGQVDDATIEIRVYASETLWPREEPVDDAGASVRVVRLGFELLVWSELQLSHRLTDLGFGAGGAARLPAQSRDRALDTLDLFAIDDDVPPRFWGRLPIDENAFQLEDAQPVMPEEGTVEYDAHEPRFPLAGPVEPSSLYLPLGMALAPSSTSTSGSVEGSRRDALTRDGVGRHTWRLFVDARFASTKANSLAASIRSQVHEVDDAAPLRGVHALWPVGEVTIAAAPDSIQPGWSDASLDVGAIKALVAPDRIEAEWGDAWLTIRWTSVPGDDVTYELESSWDAAFEAASTVAAGTSRSAQLDLPECDVRYVRVRAVFDGVAGPWSPTLVVVPPTDFVACTSALVDAADISLRSEPLALTWPETEGATGYSIQASAGPTFVAPSVETGVIDRAFFDEETDGVTVVVASLQETDSESPLIDLAADVLGAEIRYFRVRAWRDGVAGPWSNTVSWTDISETRWRADVREDGTLHETSLATQRSLLRMSAARGDIVSVLTAPLDHDAEDVMWHASVLRSQQDDESGDVPALSTDEHAALTHGALYHPWVTTRPAGHTVSTPRPVDGLMAGLMARLSLEAGAWRAPANAALPGALSLLPSIPRDVRHDQLQARVNVVRDEPSGFITLSSMTLSDNEQLEQIGTRRLMCLLRRLAQREGDRLAFESNTVETRDRVFFAFTALLEQMFARGAFAGASPAQAFQVVVDESINTQETIDRGQLFVELKVAPASPLRFLTVRLVQVDGQIVAVEEA